jgi:hypothetical protein
VAKKNDNWMKKAGVTPGKLTLIGVLAVVLCVVLYQQLRPLVKTKNTPTQLATAAHNDATSLKSAASLAEPVTTTDDNAPRKKTGTVTSWQSPNLASIVQFDPFALPASFPQPQNPDEQSAIAQNAAQAEEATADQEALDAERTKSESELEGLRQQGVAVIIKKKTEYVAIVGDQELHVGDEINGFTVISIDAKDGVRVAKDLTP